MLYVFYSPESYAGVPTLYFPFALLARPVLFFGSHRDKYVDFNLRPLGFSSQSALNKAQLGAFARSLLPELFS